MFYGGIVMMMYDFDYRSNHEPHINIKYGDQETRDFNSVIKTRPRSNNLKLMQAWIEIYQEVWQSTDKRFSKSNLYGRKKMKKVVSAKANDDFTLDIQFNDGISKRFDAKPYLDYPVFRELKNLENFKQIKIAFGTVQWKNEQDISPETLYLEGEDILKREVKGVI